MVQAVAGLEQHRLSSPDDVQALATRERVVDQHGLEHAAREDELHAHLRVGHQELHELPLRVVRVLELVDQDVPIPPPFLVEHRRVLPEQAQRQRHLVPEVEPIVGPHQPLVGLVRRRQLSVVRSAFGQGDVGGIGRDGLRQPPGVRLVQVRPDVLVP